MDLFHVLIEIISSNIFDRVDCLWLSIIVNIEDLIFIDSCYSEIIGLLIEMKRFDIVAKIEMIGFNSVDTLLCVIWWGEIVTIHKVLNINNNITLNNNYDKSLLLILTDTGSNDVKLTYYHNTT